MPVKKLKVAISDFPPLIMNSKRGYSGFEIELWEKMAKEIGLQYNYEKHDFHELITLLENKKVDVALAGITINKYREEKIDFSHPTLDSGLLILTDKNRNKIRIWDNIKYLFREGHKMMTGTLLAVLAFMIIIGHLLWLAEKNHGTFSLKYFPGIFESFWLVVCSMSTDSFGDYVPHTWLGRIITLIVIVAGVAIFGILIAQVTAFLAIKKMKGDINSSKDLAGKKVGAKKGSTSVNALNKIGARVVSVIKMEEAYKKLEQGKVDAVVFDAPALIYLAEKSDAYADKFEIAGNLFDKQKYGIALQPNSQLREPINRAILQLRESGEYDDLYKKWFGEETEME
jgi:polar amino acid transport system substrate-binding protein